MELEKLKKTDLVKLARELRQEVKLLKKQVENVKTVELDDSKLPLLAHTYYRKGNNHIVDIFRYCPTNNNIKLVNRIEETNKALALYRLEMNIAEQIESQVLEERNE